MQRSRLAAVGTVLATLALAGCGGGSESDSAPAPTSPTTTLSASATPEASPSPTSVPPNVGDRALRVGQTRRGTYVSTKLAEIRFPYPPAQYREPQNPGDKFLGLRIRQCLSKDFDAADFGGEQQTTTYNAEFAAVAPSGNESSGDGSSFNDWPRPKFPENVTLNPGDCVQGWVSLEVPGDMKIKKIVYRPAGQTVAEWLP